MEEILDQQEGQHLEHASFGARFGALIIDVIVLTIVGFAVAFIVEGGIGSMMGDPQAGFMENITASFMRVSTWINAAIFVFYFGYFESSPSQGTPGKMALNLQVVDANGKRIDMGKGMIRNVLRWVLHTSFIGILGYFLALGAKKQGLHDMVAGTQVMKK